jgi:hypothetical protein
MRAREEIQYIPAGEIKYHSSTKAEKNYRLSAFVLTRKGNGGRIYAGDPV